MDHLSKGSLQNDSDPKQPSQTLLQQNSSHIGATEMITTNLGTKDSSEINISQLMKACQFKKALSLAETKFNSKLGILKESSTKLVHLLNQMAEINIALAKFPQALELSHKSEQILNNSPQDSNYNSSIAYIYQNMALILRENHDFKEALDLINKSFDQYPRKGFQNIEIYRIKALILNDMKHYKEALEEIHKSVEIVDNSIDQIDNLEKVRVYNTLGSIHSTMKNWEKAKIAYETAMEICQKYDLTFHVEMAKACEGLGETFLEAKRSSAVVLSLGESALKIYDNCFGEDRHPARISSFLLLVKYFKQQKEPSEVLKYTNMALQEGKVLYGANSDKTREVRLRIARAAGYTQIVTTLLKPIIENGEAGKNDKELGALYLQMCEASLSCGDYDFFYKISRKAVEKLKELYGDMSLEMAKIYEEIARYYQKKKQMNKALYFLGQCVEIYKQLFGKSHLEIARLSLVISGIYCKKKDFPQSILYLEQALDIQAEFYEETHPEVIENYILLANAYGFNGEHSKSIKTHFKVLRIQEKIGDEKIYETYEAIGMLYSKFNDAKSSGNCFRKSYQMARVNLGMDDVRTLDTKEFSEFNAEEKDMFCHEQEII